MDTPVADPPAFHVTAATELAPRGAEERRLCERASSPDWLYFVPLLALNVGSVALDSALKYADGSSVRALGPSAVGLVWGATIGGGYLALPKCDPRWVGFSPPEGDVRASWPVALSLAILAGATAPVVVGVETGGLPPSWTTEERVTRLVLAGTTGFVGAFLPYLLPPRTWRAARELERLRVGASSHAASLSYTLTF